MYKNMCIYMILLHNILIGLYTLYIATVIPVCKYTIIHVSSFEKAFLCQNRRIIGSLAWFHGITIEYHSRF